MRKIRARRPGSVIGVVLLAGVFPQSARAESVGVAANVQLVQASIVSAEQAAEMLMSPTPGVLTISFPALLAGPVASSPAAGTSTQSVSLTAAGVGGDGSFVFATSKESMAIIDSVVEQLGSAAEQVSLDGVLSRPLSATGYIDGKGFQMVVLKVTRNGDGSGYISAIIPFN